MVNYEGLRSYKAIAFIKSNPDFESLKANSYVLLDAIFLPNTILAKKDLLREFSKNLGEKLWIK